MSDSLRDRLAFEHLGKLLAHPEFARASVQGKALSALTRAALEGRTPTGSELALEVYGRSDERYIRALRQLVREIRSKLMRIYAQGEPVPVQFRLPEAGYQMAIVFRPQPGPSTDAPASTEAPADAHVPTWIDARSVRIGVLALVVLGLASWGAYRAFRPAPVPAAFAVQSGRVAVLDASGREIACFRGSLPTPVTSAAGVVVTGPEGRPLAAVAACDGTRPRGCVLVALDARSGKLLDSVPLPLLAAGGTLPERIHEADGDEDIAGFNVAQALAADLDGDGRRDEVVLSLRHSRIFPNQILGLERTRSGWRVLLDYWSMGHVQLDSIGDADGDGKEDLLVYGSNNADQEAIVVLLPAADPGHPTVGRTPDGRRPAFLRELADYPQRGLVLRFPRLELTSPSFPEYFRLRATTSRIQWSAAERVLRVVVDDTSPAAQPDTSLGLEFQFNVERGEVHVQFPAYDATLQAFLALIHSGRLPDRWGIADRGMLDGYGRDLATRVLCYDDTEPQAGYRPFEPARLARRLGIGRPR